MEKSIIFTHSFKSRRVFLCMLMIFSLISSHSYAQLEVLTSGNVVAAKKLAVGTTINQQVCLNLSCTAQSGISPFYGIKSMIYTSTSMPTSPMYAMYAYANASASQYTSTNYPIVGVYGYASKNFGSPIFNAGVVGVAHYAGGIGIYGGGVLTSLPTTLPAYEKYAGYFDGTVKVNGAFLATTIVLSGDTLKVDNIQRVRNGVTHNLDMLHPVSYTYKPDTTWMDEENIKALSELTHYGLMAQDVQKVYPELVIEQGGNLSINYIELIPLLLMRMQELSAEVEELKKLLTTSK